MPTIKCPACKASLKCPDLLMGRSIKCPKCTLPFIASQQEEKTTPPQSSSPTTAPSTIATSTKPCPFCGKIILKVSLKCKYCGEHLNSAVNTANPNQSEPVNAVSGIGGWLTLFVLGLIFTPIQVTYFLYSQFFPFFSTGAWGILTTPGSREYHVLWAPLLIFKLLSFIGAFVLSLVTLWCLFGKSRWTPRLAIAGLSWGLFFEALNFFTAGMIPALAAQNDLTFLNNLGLTLIGALIWIPYFLLSKRVKATFVC